MRAPDIAGGECACGCGSPMVASEYGPVCTCECEAELKPKTTAQEIHDLRVQQVALERRLHELVAKHGSEIAA